MSSGPTASPTAGPTPLDWARFAFLVAVWGSAFAVIDIAVDTAAPPLVVSLRLWIAAAFLVGWVMARGGRLPRLWPRPDPIWGWFAVMGLFGNALPFFLVSSAQEVVPSAVAGILNGASPLMTAALAHVFVAGERMTPRRAVGFAIGFAGVVVLVGPDAVADLGGAETLAQLAVLGAAASYAVNSILAQRSPVTAPSVTAAGMVLAAAVIATPLGIYGALTAEAPPAPASLLATAWLALGPTGLASIVYVAVIRSAGPSFMSLSVYLVPVTAVVIGVWLVGDAIAPRAYAAVAIIITGLIAATRRAR